MATIFEKILPVSLEEEMKSSYIDYAMSVIVARALPDVRDGLKPAHRRVLYGMSELGLAFNRPYKVGRISEKFLVSIIHMGCLLFMTLCQNVSDFTS